MRLHVLMGLLLLGGCLPAVPTAALEPPAEPAPQASAAATATPPVRSRAALFAAVFDPHPVPNQPFNRLVHGNPIDWPPMRYLGEGVTVRGRTLTPTEVRVVPGQHTLVAYAPYLDEGIPADHLMEGNRYTHQRPPISISLFIPPGASLVMVHLELDPAAGHWDPELGTVCDEDPYDGPLPTALRLSYPGLGEHGLPDSGTGCTPSFCPYHFAEMTQPPYACPYTGWYYFYLPTLEIDPAQLWLAYVTTDELVFWTLAARP